MLCQIYNHLKKISFFKIDVQGYDLNVLKGAKNTILKHKMPIMFEYEKDFENEFDFWVNITPTGSFNVKHCHPNCDIAGVLLIKIPKNSGEITFISPYDFLSFLEMHSYTEEFQKDTNYYHNYTFPAREGSILLFPSHIQHKVEENKSKEDRISVSFNLKLLNDNY